MAGRRKGRILAFQALYAWDVAGTPLKDLLTLGWLDVDKKDGLDETLLAFTSLLITGTIENSASIDACIKKNLTSWDFDRLAKVDLALLRVSAYSLLFQKDLASSIVIDEAVEIAKEYCADESFKFVNGVLDGIRKSALRE